MKTKEYREYLKKLIKAMDLTPDEVSDIESQIKHDYEVYLKQVRRAQGEEILKSIGL